MPLASEKEVLALGVARCKAGKPKRSYDYHDRDMTRTGESEIQFGPIGRVRAKQPPQRTGLAVNITFKDPLGH
jgi:hypothetical protein